MILFLTFIGMLTLPLRHWVIPSKLITHTGLGALSILGWAIKNVLPSDNVTSAVSTTVYGVGAATTISVTALAVARLLLVRRCHIKLMGKCNFSKQKKNTSVLTPRSLTRKVWHFKSICEHRCYHNRVLCSRIYMVTHNYDLERTE